MLVILVMVIVVIIVTLETVLANMQGKNIMTSQFQLKTTQ